MAELIEHTEGSATSEKRSSPRLRVFILTMIGFFAYGGWAFYSNFPHGLGWACKSGLVQGTTSAITTFVIATGIETLRRWLRWIKNERARLLITALLPPTAASFFHFFAHLIVGTPEIIQTILPSVIMGYVFALAYLIGVRKLDSRKR